MRIQHVIFILCILSAGIPSFAQEALVKIYNESPGGHSQGTGFFTSDDGQIVTAYHVIKGANGIRVVHDKLGMFENIIVEFIAPEYDLAVLQISNFIAKPSWLHLDRNPDLTVELQLKGYPRGGMLQQFRGYATRSEFVNSHTIRDRRGMRLFKAEIDVIPLDLSIYTGLSGGPVIGLRGVIGVLSGSYSEGGGIGWAIPSKYLSAEYLTNIHQIPKEISWPDLKMSAAWRNLRTTVWKNVEAGQILEQYLEEVETAARIFDEFYQQALTVRINVLAHKPFLQRVITDPVLKRDWEEANQFLNPTGSQAFRSLRIFLDLSTKFADIGRSLPPALARLITWINNESGLDQESGAEYAKELRKIRNQIQDFTGGIDAYLNINTQDVSAAFPTLMQELKQNKESVEGTVNAQLEFFNTWLIAIERYASGDALIFMTGSINAFRQAARLFEPIVYEVR